MDQEQLKHAVAAAAVEYTLTKIDSDSIVGIGTGSTANFFIDLLAEHKEKFQAAVASSEASADRLRGHGIDVIELNSAPEITIYIDGADEANPRLELIKGGGCRSYPRKNCYRPLPMNLSVSPMRVNGSTIWEPSLCRLK